ncbi:Anaphase-promoting complex subunit 3 protein [Oryctes borbonicus]|uniref:Anaphase-promoting complex subunit 3 protein n=1 Tax=Oryctes borbonicus TaxID=1629725 RepID=A0A0T6B5W0_9SCAR|nr:Anaphase-promoting complex subunit 3 protein [Oryctes borbonicus]
MDTLDIKAQLFYLSRELLYNTLLVKCKDYISRYNTDSTLHFHHALALLLNQRYQESIRECESLKSEMSTRLASILTIMYAHRFSNTDDKQLFANLEIELREAKNSATSVDLYYTAYSLFAFGKYEKALDYVMKAINQDSTSCEYWSLKGWICIYLNQNGFKQETNIPDMFKNAMKDNLRNLDASIGLSISLNMEKNTDAALNTINKAIVRFPSNILPLIAKMDYLFSNYEWDQTSEIVNRILDMDPNNLQAMTTNVLILICHNGKFEEAAVSIKRLLMEMYEQEPKNSKLYFETAVLFSRISNRNIFVLSETYKLMEKALSISLNDPDIIVELGYQALLQGDIKEASHCFKSVIKIDESSVKALMGLMLCEFNDKKRRDHVRDQIEFLLELQENNIPPLLLLMKARLLENTTEIFKYLDSAAEEQIAATKRYLFGKKYLELLDPNTLLEIAKEYLKFVPFSTNVENFTITPNVDKAVKASLSILKVLTKACPGCEEALYLQAKILYFKGDSVEATRILDHIIKKLDTTSSDAYLLMAQIQISNKLYDRASQSLEAGLSHNFKVRENPLYHLISGLIEKSCDNLEEAVKHFTTALSLIDLKSKDSQSKTSISESQIDFSLADKASIYTELIQVHSSLRQLHEATKLLHVASEEFQGTTEEAKITLMNADHLIQNKDSQTAIDILSRIKPNDAYYLQAKTKLAKIYLKQRKDRRAYLKCYEEMIANMPGSDSFVLLGDAYMNILELDKALEAYEEALKLQPTDPFLTKKMGEALVTTHNFQRAVAYYKDTIKLTDNPELKLELADLYVKLKQLDNAESFLKHEIEYEKNKNINDIACLTYMTKLYNLLAEIYERLTKLTEALNTLKSASENQQRLQKLYSMSQRALPEDELQTSVDLFVKMSEISISLRGLDQAVEYYKQALNVSPNNCKVLVCLAKLYMQMNDMDLCQQTCTTLLSLDPENEDGIVLMADIAFRKIDFDMAVHHFTQLLSKQPTNWRALVRFIEIMRRTGNLQGVLKYIEHAEKLCSSPNKDSGFCYCLGLYQWYSGNLNGALRNFNVARQSPEWSKLAIYNMIEICLNPEDEILGDQFIDVDDIEYRDSRSMALKTAERLLKELKQKNDATGDDPLKYKLFKNFLLLASKQKVNIETALEDFISIASTEMYKDEVGPVLGIATAHTMLKQSQRAKNQLKRVAKNVWSFEDADYLESCWLLLADYYMQSSKYDLAHELLKKILQHNKACSKAHEFCGMIAEKEQKYKEAANAYNQAWKFGGKSNPGVGYKLAYNFLKCKKYADAIDVCQQVLKQHPEYPKIKKDILDKALANLRT